MPYRIIDGCLIDSVKSGDFEIIAHSANCFHLMGSGIARAIHDNFEEAYNADLKTPHGSYNKLGQISLCKTKNGTYIANIYGQFAPGANGDLLAIELGLKKVAYFMKKTKLAHIGLPQLGCGIGGLEWKDVEAAIKRQLNGFQVTVVRYNKVLSDV